MIVQAYLRDISGLVPDHCSKVNITIEQATRIFWAPSTYKSHYLHYIVVLSAW